MHLISWRLAFVLTLLLFSIAAGQTLSTNESVRLLPKSVGNFRAMGVRPQTSDPKRAEDFRIQDAASGTYTSRTGEKLSVSIIRTQSQSAAYALLSEASAEMRRQGQTTKTRDIGIAGLASAGRMIFYKGAVFVSITGGSNHGDENSTHTFARDFAGTLEDIQNEIPVLVKHLPDWEAAQDRARYAVSSRTLQEVVGRQTVLSAVSFDEGTEAVAADYGASRLVIVEYATPQIAESNDARINQGIEDLRATRNSALGSIPSVYRRVGNYSVFVWNAPDETAALQLVDAVKYEQKIQWLGQNPFAFEEAEKQYTQKAVSLILGIAKAIGFFVALCLGAGGIVGGIAFLHRRSQQRAAAESYSDAGGMLRLNLDERTTETDPARLLTSEGKNAVSP